MANPPPPPAWPGQPQATDAIAPGPYGGFWIRFVAYMIDGLVLSLAAAVMVAIFAAFVVLTGMEHDSEEPSLEIILGAILMILALIVVNWLYEALMTSSPRGATLGKMAIGVRIVRVDGAQLSFGRATARHFLKVMITPLVPLAIGYLMAAFTARKRALHDVLADTLVVRVP
ncbi:MAG: RDD family protein [Reyranella sp.]|nr:RDD family protein [Reyranella sp.]